MFRQGCFQNPRPPNFNVDAFLFFGLRGPLICFVPSPGVPNDAQHWNWGDRGTHFEYPLILLSIYSIWGRQNSWAKHLQMFLLQHLSPNPLTNTLNSGSVWIFDKYGAGLNVFSMCSTNRGRGVRSSPASHANFIPLPWAWFITQTATEYRKLAGAFFHDYSSPDSRCKTLT